MFNLLPKPEKDAIRREYRLRLATVVLWFLCATLLISSLLLLPSWFLSVQKEGAAERRSIALSESVAQRELAGFEGTLRATEEQLALLSRESPKGRFYELIGEIAARRPENVSFESITVTGRADGKHSMIVSGIASDRDSLVVFSRSLGAISLLEKAELPLSNLAKKSDISFSLSAPLSF